MISDGNLGVWWCLYVVGIVGVYWGYLDGFGLGLVLKAGNLLQLCMCFISHVEIVL